MKSGVALAAVGVAGLSIAKVGSTFADENPEAAAQAVSADSLGTQSGVLASDSGSNIPAPNAASPASPPGVQVDGIDVSNHNGDVDWNRVFAAGRRFAFVLATDGDDFRSSRFDSQYAGAKNAGLMIGAYHFGRPNNSAVVQADRLLGTVRYVADGRTLPPVLDLEVDSGGSCYGTSSGELHEWVKTFVDRVKAGTGRDAIIYASPSFWNRCMGGSPAFNTHPLWLASYDVQTPTIPGGWQSYTFWQHSENGSVDGVSGDVDVNKFNGGLDQLRKLAAN